MANMFTKAVARELDPNKTYIIEIALNTFTREQAEQLREALKHSGVNAIVAVTPSGDDINVKQVPTEVTK